MCREGIVKYISTWKGPSGKQNCFMTVTKYDTEHNHEETGDHIDHKLFG